MEGSGAGGGVLVVASSAVERELRRAIGRSNADTHLEFAGSAAETVQRVSGNEPFAGRPRPAAVCIDLECAGVDGLALLETIKGGPETRVTPVFVLASDDPCVVDRSYRLRANAVLRRPATTDEYDDLVRAFDRFWLSRVCSPSLR